MGGDVFGGMSDAPFDPFDRLRAGRLRTHGDTLCGRDDRGPGRRFLDLARNDSDRRNDGQDCKLGIN